MVRSSLLAFRLIEQDWIVDDHSHCGHTHQRVFMVEGVSHFVEKCRSSIQVHKVNVVLTCVRKCATIIYKLCPVVMETGQRNIR